MNCIIGVNSSITAYILLYQFFRDDIVQGNSGKHLTMIPPLGYMKDPEDKNKWIVDEEDALIVKEIFNLCVKDYGPSQIARILTERVIETPSLYLHRKKLPCSVKIKQNAEVWDYSILVGILENEEYRGGFVLSPSRNGRNLHSYYDCFARLHLLCVLKKKETTLRKNSGKRS